MKAINFNLKIQEISNTAKIDSIQKVEGGCALGEAHISIFFLAWENWKPGMQFLLKGNFWKHKVKNSNIWFSDMGTCSTC